MKKTIFLLSILLLDSLHNLSFCQSTVPSFVKDSLDTYVTRAIKDYKIPGVAVCVVKDSQVVLMKGYGVKELGSDDRIDENTLFMIGSNTKAFTATALAMLHVEEKLSLDDKVTKWLPEFKLDNKLAGEQATIRDLLCHRLGFQSGQGNFAMAKSNLTRAQIIEKMGRIKAVYPFRTTWGYNNAAFVTAGETIPRATGMKWEQYLIAKIFTPLGMTRTLALSSDMLKATNKAMPHTIVEGKLVTIPFDSYDNMAGGGGMSSSVNDLSRWLIAHLNDGKSGGKQILPAAAIAATRTPHSIIGDGNFLFNKGQFSLYGLGFFIDDYEGRKILSHSGWATGFITEVTLIPEEKLGVIVITNTDKFNFSDALEKEIVDAYLKLPYRNYSEVYMDSYTKHNLEQEKNHRLLADSVTLHLKTELPLKEYSGKYFNDVYGDMQVVLEKGELKMKLSHHPDMQVDLRPLGGNRFYTIYSDPIFGKAVSSFRVENNKVKAALIGAPVYLETPHVFLKTNQ
jgi:CubicO group peptidase (beta-lactamase class C family)